MKIRKKLLYYFAENYNEVTPLHCNPNVDFAYSGNFDDDNTKNKQYPARKFGLLYMVDDAWGYCIFLFRLPQMILPNL